MYIGLLLRDPISLTSISFSCFRDFLGVSTEIIMLSAKDSLPSFLVHNRIHMASLSCMMVWPGIPRLVLDGQRKAGQPSQLQEKRPSPPPSEDAVLSGTSHQIETNSVQLLFIEWFLKHFHLKWVILSKIVGFSPTIKIVICFHFHMKRFSNCKLTLDSRIKYVRPDWEKDKKFQIYLFCSHTCTL